MTPKCEMDDIWVLFFVSRFGRFGRFLLAGLLVEYDRTYVKFGYTYESGIEEKTRKMYNLVVCWLLLEVMS